MRKFILFLFTLAVTTFSFAQPGPKWSTGGNSIGSSDFLGSTNNFPLVFKANNQIWMRILPTGVIQINSIANLGTGVVTFDNNGNLIPLVYANDPTKVLYSNGTWGSINFSNSGWTNGYNIFYNGSGNVGIGTPNPTYKLDVWGNLRVTGTVFASGVVITDEVKADTGRIGVIADDVALIGNVGVGGGAISSVKLNVVGDIRTSGKLQVFRIIPLPGDSEIHFGDSSITLVPNYNAITWSSIFNHSGLCIGNNPATTKLAGFNSVGIGFRFIGTDVAANNSVVIGLGYNSANYLTNTIANSFMVGYNSNVPTFFVGPAPHVLNATGNVGIATTNPTEKLQVNGNILVRGANWINNGDNGILYLGDNNNFIKATFGGGVTIGVYDGVGAPMDAMSIEQGGNVQIGTILNPDPAFKLSVNGKIRAKELKVYPTWSDFVFKPGYYLMPLDSLGKFIIANGYLPNVPSALEVEKNGIDVGSSNAILLRKIEELTLYVLALDEKSNASTAENKILKEEIALLKKEIELLKLLLQQQQTKSK